MRHLPGRACGWGRATRRCWGRATRRCHRGAPGTGRAELWPVLGSHGREQARGSSGTGTGTQAPPRLQQGPVARQNPFPTRPPAPCPALRLPHRGVGWWPPSLLGQAQSPNTGAGCRQHGAVDHVQSQDVPREPAFVPGGRTMPGELPGHHGLLHTAWPGSHLQLPRRAQPRTGVPPALSCPPAALTAAPVPVGALGAAARLGSARHGTAQPLGPLRAHSQAPGARSCAVVPPEPPCEPRPAAPAHRREGTGGSRSDGAGAGTGSRGPTPVPGRI